MKIELDMKKFQEAVSLELELIRRVERLRRRGEDLCEEGKRIAESPQVRERHVTFTGDHAMRMAAMAGHATNMARNVASSVEGFATILREIDPASLDTSLDVEEAKERAARCAAEADAAMSGGGAGGDGERSRHAIGRAIRSVIEAAFAGMEPELRRANVDRLRDMERDAFTQMEYAAGVAAALDTLWSLALSASMEAGVLDGEMDEDEDRPSRNTRALTGHYMRQHQQQQVHAEVMSAALSGRLDLKMDITRSALAKAEAEAAAHAEDE